MNRTLLPSFDTSFKRVGHALSTLHEGHSIMVPDDEDRKGEGDMIFPVETMTVEQMALTVRYGSGIVCLYIAEDRRKQLDLPMMVENNTNAYGTGLTVAIEAAEGVTTGVPVTDRVTMIRATIRDGAKPSDLNRPGHVLPLCVQAGGVLTCGGHTEVTTGLMTLTGFEPAGVLCGLTNNDSTIVRTPGCVEFAGKHNVTVVTTEDLAAYRQVHERKASQLLAAVTAAVGIKEPESVFQLRSLVIAAWLFFPGQFKYPDSAHYQQQH